MANTVARVRFVRCPKCLKLLPEFADVPMYQCGGCGAVLQSKNYNIDTSCASLDNESLNRYCREKREGSSDEGEGEEKSLNLSERGSDTLMSSRASLSQRVVASEEEIIDEGRRSDSLISPPAAAVASSDNGSPDRVRESCHPLSRRTPRSQRSSSSGCSSIGKEKRVASLGSESFYSVQTSIESEDLSVREFESTSTTKLKHLNQNRSELLKLVEELKHQLGRSHEERMESKKPIQRTFPDLCCNRSSCHPAGSHDCCACSAASSYTRKSRPPAKRFFRPVLGGAPFVVCYKCFEMLHMPADLLISTNKLNKLKCRACSEILALPFPARARPVPQASAEYGNSPEGPVSFSEEYGVSLAESCSTETGPALNTSRVSSGESRDVDGPGLPLHRVMGYPSARMLLY